MHTPGNVQVPLCWQGIGHSGTEQSYPVHPWFDAKARIGQAHLRGLRTPDSNSLSHERARAATRRKPIQISPDIDDAVAFIGLGSTMQRRDCRISVSSVFPASFYPAKFRRALENMRRSNKHRFRRQLHSLSPSTKRKIPRLELGRMKARRCVVPAHLCAMANVRGNACAVVEAPPDHLVHAFAPFFLEDGAG